MVGCLYEVMSVGVVIGCVIRGCIDRVCQQRIDRLIGYVISV